MHGVEMRVRPIRRVALAALLAAALAGCLAEGPGPVAPSGPPPASAEPGRSAPPSATRSAAPGLTATPIPPIWARGPGFELPSAAPPVAVEPGLRLAVTEVDGVRITIEVDRNPLAAGQPAWITTTLENTGPDTVRWMTDGCSIHVGTRGEMPFRWAPGFVQEDAAKTFKDWADIAEASIHRPVWLEAVPEKYVGRERVACADLGVAHELRPGRQIRERHRWDGQSGGGLGLPPSGPAVWIGEFRTWWRASDPGADFGDSNREPVVVRLAVEVVDGRDPRLLSVGQAIDVAVTVPAFRALLDANPSIRDWDMPIITRFDVPSGLWQIGLKTNDGFGVTVHIEPLTGEVIRVVRSP
jgi:hypothetical protein